MDLVLLVGAENSIQLGLQKATDARMAVIAIARQSFILVSNIGKSQIVKNRVALKANRSPGILITPNVDIVA